MSHDFVDNLRMDRFRGVLLGTLEIFQPDQPGTLYQLSDGELIVPVIVPNPDLAHRLLSQPLATHSFHLVDMVADTAEGKRLPSILVDADRSSLNEALYQLPLDLCPLENVHLATVARIEQISATPLREMVKRIFLDREVCARYWTLPASAHYHHAYPGGLAQHTLEVASDLAEQMQLTEVEWDLGVAGALLHDMGKVWAYGPNMFLNNAGLAMGHELLGLSRLERELSILESHWPDGAYALRVLISGCGRMRPDGSLPSALLARIKAADQRSCERDRSSRPKHRRSWVPQGWTLEGSGPEAD